MLKLMYITNQPQIAQIAQAAGVDRVFVDLESWGKQARQGGMDTVQSHHTLEDVAAIRSVVTDAELLVRCNPIYKDVSGISAWRDEIESIIHNGADVIMLPYFKSVEEAALFIETVDGRAKTDLLIETPEAVASIDEILTLPGIDEVHIGINDLSLGYHKKFMFELFSDGTVEYLCRKFQDAGLPFGIGGIASLGRGLLPAEYLIKEHYRLGSTAAILSRSFCNANRIADMNIIRRIFHNGVKDIRAFEEECAQADAENLMDNKVALDKVVTGIVG